MKVGTQPKILRTSKRNIKVEKEPDKEANKPLKETIPDYARGYALGIENGFKLGLEKQPNSELLERIAFDQGIKHIVTLAEDFLVKELKLTSRDELAVSGKIPSWWIATLVAYCAKGHILGLTAGVPRAAI